MLDRKSKNNGNRLYNFSDHHLSKVQVGVQRCSSRSLNEISTGYSTEHPDRNALQWLSQLEHDHSMLSLID